MLNSCILTGNLGADPEIFYSSEGEPVATFNLAFKSGKKKTGWIKVTCFQRPCAFMWGLLCPNPHVDSIAVAGGSPHIGAFSEHTQITTELDI